MTPYYITDYELLKESLEEIGKSQERINELKKVIKGETQFHFAFGGRRETPEQEEYEEFWKPVLLSFLGYLWDKHKAIKREIRDCLEDDDEEQTENAYGD